MDKDTKTIQEVSGNSTDGSFTTRKEVPGRFSNAGKIRIAGSKSEHNLKGYYRVTGSPPILRSTKGLIDRIPKTIKLVLLFSAGLLYNPPLFHELYWDHAETIGGIGHS